MKNMPQYVVLAFIILGGFWIGMEWGSQARPASQNPIIPEVSQPPVTVVPVIVPAEEVDDTTSSTTPDSDTTTSTPVPVVTNTVVDPNLPKKISETMNHYSNSNFRYEFDIPANVYYSGFNGENGARHTVGIGKENPETLSGAAIRVYFYGKKIVPELQNAQNNKYEDPAGAYVYLLLDGGYSVKIEALNINHPIVQKIIETIKVF